MATTRGMQMMWGSVLAFVIAVVCARGVYSAAAAISLEYACTDRDGMFLQAFACKLKGAANSTLDIVTAQLHDERKTHEADKLQMQKQHERDLERCQTQCQIKIKDAKISWYWWSDVRRDMKSAAEVVWNAATSWTTYLQIIGVISAGAIAVRFVMYCFARMPLPNRKPPRIDDHKPTLPIAPSVPPPMLPPSDANVTNVTDVTNMDLAAEVLAAAKAATRGGAQRRNAVVQLLLQRNVHDTSTHEAVYERVKLKHLLDACTVADIAELL